MIRPDIQSSTTVGARPSRHARRTMVACVLFCAAVFLFPVTASAGGANSQARNVRHAERLQSQQLKRGGVPHNARYRNPPRPRPARQNPFTPNDRFDGHARGDRDRHDGRAFDRGRRVDRHDYRGKHDGRYGHGKAGHHGHRGYRYRARVYRPYGYVPYYAPVVVAYPYYCDLCHHGFYAESLFYDHLCFVHHLSRRLVPGLLYWYGGTFIFGGW